MNYIRHLNAFFSLIKTDTRLTTSHVSLYMALFHYWNFNRFHNPFSIYRENIMQLSKIGSKNTYHKCIKELHQAKYIFYHPAPSKFQVVRISIIRLDVEPEKPTRYRQLNLFAAQSHPLSEGDLGRGLSPNNATDNVPKLGQRSTDFDTGTVSKLGHLIKPNINKQRETPSQQIFKRNKKIQEPINDFAAGVPNSVRQQPSESCHSDKGGISNASLTIPPKQEVLSFFQLNNHPADEAMKFFNHYQALHWKLQGKTPILDWKPLVEKWMTNAKKWMSPSGGGVPIYRDGGDKTCETEIQCLYNCFLEGKNIFRHITTEHYNHLKLSINDEIMQQAWQERINQVSGTNQHSLIELWKAYLTGDPNHQLLQKDKPNLISLAKRIAVINYFHRLKHSGSPLSLSGGGSSATQNGLPSGQAQP